MQTTNQLDVETWLSATVGLAGRSTRHSGSPPPAIKTRDSWAHQGLQAGNRSNKVNKRKSITKT
jgi:hypothetical protein